MRHECGSTGDRGAPLYELPLAVERLSAYAADLARYVEGPISLADVPGAYRNLIAGNATKLKTIIDLSLV